MKKSSKIFPECLLKSWNNRFIKTNYTLSLHFYFSEESSENLSFIFLTILREINAFVGQRVFLAKILGKRKIPSSLDALENNKVAFSLKWSSKLSQSNKFNLYTANQKHLNLMTKVTVILCS